MNNGRIKTFTDNKKFCNMIIEEPKNCNNYYTNSLVIAKEVRNMIDRAAFWIQIELVKRKGELESLIFGKLGLLMHKE